ncbi:MAG TPA: glycoside hydrolase family 172 protein [Phycisphaerae bacterium]
MLSGLPKLRDYYSKRISSYDRAGGNRDWVDIEPGERRVLAEVDGPGCIRHIWMTMLFQNDDHLRRVVLRFFWDGCAEPSVECPIGDFFGLGHAKRKNFVTAVLAMSPEDGRAFNSYWPMPFRTAARIEVENQGTEKYPHYYYIDYEAYDSPQPLDGMGYFHVQWRRENPTQGWGDEYNHLQQEDPAQWREKLWHGGDPRSLNLSNQDNYVILEAQGNGIYCGAHLDIDIFERQKNDWYGEGDDMIFIDGEPWPPSLHGTGTEDWFNCAFGPTQEYAAPYHGILLHSASADCKWFGKQSVYRYHIQDPIRFRKSIQVSIEHGHANKLSNDYSSTAYYYLDRPQRSGSRLLPVPERLPRP